MKIVGIARNKTSKTEIAPSGKVRKIIVKPRIEHKNMRILSIKNFYLLE
jgi:hypothetical protein